MMQGVQNKIDVTFSESKSSYTLTVYLVEKHTVAQLVEKIRKRGFISKEATLSKSMFPLLDHWVGVNKFSESGGPGCGYYAWTRDVDVEGSHIDDEGDVAL